MNLFLHAPFSTVSVLISSSKGASYDKEQKTDLSILKQSNKITPYLLLINQLKLVNKKDKMLKTRIQVRLFTESHNSREMCVVDVRIDPEQTFENVAETGLECFGEGNAYL